MKLFITIIFKGMPRLPVSVVVMKGNINMKSKVTLLWVSAIGSTIIALYVLLIIGFITSTFLFKINSVHMGFFLNKNWLSWILAIIIWILFPLIYLWLRRDKSEINKNKLFKYGAFSNAAVFVTPPILFIMCLFLNEL